MRISRRISSSRVVGEIAAYGGSSAPTGWLLCDGSAVSRTTYGALFAITGTAYGAGDGSTTFNLPDFQGRSILGAGAGASLTVRARGDTGGAETVALVTANLASHSHTNGRSASSDGAPAGSGNDKWYGAALSTGSSGSGTAHQNMAPFGCANYIIKT